MDVNIFSNLYENYLFGCFRYNRGYFVNVFSEGKTYGDIVPICFDRTSKS